MLERQRDEVGLVERNKTVSRRLRSRCLMAGTDRRSVLNLMVNKPGSLEKEL